MYCSNCGKQYEGSFCPECGTSSQKTELKTDNAENKFSVPENSDNEPQIFKLSAGPITLCGQRRLVTEFLVRGDQITAISYNRTTLSKPVSSCSFYKKNIKSVIFDITFRFRTLDKINLVAFSLLTLLGFFEPFLFYLFPLCIIAVCNRSSYDTMIVTLDNGVQVKAYYRKQVETEDIYRILTK